MKSFENKEINYSLHNSENYKKELSSEILDVVEKVSRLFIDYFKFITENIKLKKSSFSRFIISRGLDTIIHVFNHILFYTKNLDVTYFHCQKAFYFYIEFVGQISEDEKMFLQLSSRDASTYVYKKTIFEISNELKKNNEGITDYTRYKFDIINEYIDLYKTLLLKIISNDFMILERINDVENLYHKLNNLSNKSNIKLINNIIGKFYYEIEDINYFFDICSLIIKKLGKNQELFDNFIDKFLQEDFKNRIQDHPDKFINWFIN